jgi:hypothetical protein
VSEEFEIDEYEEEEEIEETPSFKMNESEDLTIPDTPSIPEDEGQVEKTEELDAEETFGDDSEGRDSPEGEAPKRKLPYLWIGVGIGIVLAIIIEVLFSIPLWSSGTNRADLLYIELVLIFIAMMIPGLLTRSIQKGLIGGAIIFAISFGLPFLINIKSVLISNPLTPLYSSTAFALEAYSVFENLFSIDFDLAGIQKWIWTIDLVLFFLLMVIITTLGSWLIKNITVSKKKTKHWIGIPLLSLGLIIFIIVLPLIFSSTFGVIQASTAYLAGSSKFSEATSLFQESDGQLSTSELETLEETLGQASYWFNLSETNYRGLKNIGVINMAQMFAGEYAPLIEAGDQLALATLSFTKIVYPLFTGINDLTSSLNNATQNIANFGSEGSSTDYSSLAIQPKQFETLDELLEAIQEAIGQLEQTKSDLTQVNDQLQKDKLSDSFEETYQKLQEIDLEKLNPKLKETIEQLRNTLGDYKGEVAGFESFLNYTTTVIDPTKDLLWVSYYTLVGNDHLRNYRFNDAIEPFENASVIVQDIDLTEYNPPQEIGDLFSIEITDQFSLLLEDFISLLDPLLIEEIYFSNTYQRISDLYQYFSTIDYNVSLINWGLIPTDLLTVANETEYYGGLAEDQLTVIRYNLQQNEYGDFFDSIGDNFDKIFTSDFSPNEFGSKTNYFANIMVTFLDACNAYVVDENFVYASNTIAIATTIATDEIIGKFATDTPEYFSNYLETWCYAVLDLETTINENNNALTYENGLLEMQTILQSIETDVNPK